MTTLREAAQQALETLEALSGAENILWVQRRAEIEVEYLRAALAQEEQEPVAWMVYTLDGKSVCVTDNPADFAEGHRALPLYPHPPRRGWRSLSDGEIGMEYVKWDATPGASMANFARAIEQALRSKNQ
jgi:hypothetical protein